MHVRTIREISNDAQPFASGPRGLDTLVVCPSWAGPVDINTADAETLSAELNGIGMARALAIVEYRDQHGPFKSADELTNVTGIGQHTLELNRQFILVGASKERARN